MLLFRKDLDNLAYSFPVLGFEYFRINLAFANKQSYEHLIISAIQVSAALLFATYSYV